MARMIPLFDKPGLELLASRAEKHVYEAFRDKLPESFLVIHSLDMVSRPHGGEARDAEADFVLFDEQRGFIVVEVKGGGIDFNAKTRKWTSRDRRGSLHEIKDPFKQARNCKHQVLETIKSGKQWGSFGMPRIVAGHAVLFPDLTRTEMLAGPDRPKEIIGNHASLEDAANWVSQVFDFWSGQSGISSPLGSIGMNVVESLFCRSVHLEVPLALALEQESRRQIELTERQARVLRSLRYRNRAAISGGAGTGKTLIAFQHAKSLAAQGGQTLLVCYNRALADFLKHEAGGETRLHCMSFHQLCDWRLRVIQAKKGIDLLREAEAAYPRTSKYDVQYPYALARSTELDDFRYDAVVVDEGQDFGEEYWLPIELLIRDYDNTPFYIFFDPNQSVYRNASTFPIPDAPFCLTENCRNTRNIHQIAYEYYTGDEVDPPDIEGEPPRFIMVEGLESQAKRIKNLVSELIDQQEISPSDIAVLILSKNKSPYYAVLESAGNPSKARWSMESLWAPSSVLVDTVRRFKGLEAGIVILWGIEDVSAEADRELLYVALSRARFRLFVVGSKSSSGLSVWSRLISGTSSPNQHQP